jgi:O-acetyl-ADP-ribose deacetylase (regulator of RNase III)
MPINLVQGNLLKQEDVDAIVNTVNCVGVMGKGIALQFKNKWPANYQQYEIACKRKLVKTGEMFVHDSGGLIKPNFIINFPTKNHWRGSSKIEFIQEGLEDLIVQIKRLNIKSIAIPPLGCGNGGLSWAEVRPLIEQAFSNIPEVDVRLFEPSGTPAAKEMEVKTPKPKMTNGRAAILKAIETYCDIGYGLSKIEVQKLAYFLQQAGEDLRLTFHKHTYGPYSEQLRHALNHMEGHYIVGLGDGVVVSEIEPVAEALQEADKYIANAGNHLLQDRVARITALIDGFQSPYGMELLATVHWVATNDPNVTSNESAISAVHAWNSRKQQLMTHEHVNIAWSRLKSQGWLNSCH